MPSVLGRLRVYIRRNEIRALSANSQILCVQISLSNRPSLPCAVSQMAVTTFSGRFSAARADFFKAKEAELRKAAAADGIQLSQDPQEVKLAGYNPPWCLPWLRTNEIMIPVTGQ